MRFVIIICLFISFSGFSQVENEVLEDCMLNFPDLRGVNINLVKKERTIPLTTVPSPINFFRAKKNWKYTITISTKSNEKLSPILYENLSRPAQKGVLAHEVSHVYDFHTNSRWYLLKVLFFHLSSRKLDAFEFNTDHICIQKGLGRELLQWSKEVREKLDIEDWKGVQENTETEERYMSPKTICRYMAKYPELYPRGCEVE